MTNHTPGYDRDIPKNLLEVAHEETGKWMQRDELEAWVFSRFRRLERERDICRDYLAAIAEMTGNGDDIGAAHEGVNALAEDLARHKRMFVAACETLGEIQQALGNCIVGIEPALVKELVQERDALAAQLQEFRKKSQELHSQYPLSPWIQQHYESVMRANPEQTLAHRDELKQVEGMKKAALFIEQKADAYDAEHGTTDPTTNHREYPGDGAEYFNELMELADELRQFAEGHQ